jgi:WD40 repeat protein
MIRLIRAGRWAAPALLLLLAPAAAPAQRELASFPIASLGGRPLIAVAVAPDGKFAAALMRGYGKGKGQDVANDHVRVWDLKAKKQALLFQAGFAGLYPGALFAYTPDGKRLVASTSKGLYVFDAKTGRQDKAFEPRLSPSVACLAHDGKAALCAAGGELAAYDLKSGKELFAVKAKMSSVRHLAASPDGRLAAASDSKGNVYLFDLKARKELAALPKGKRVGTTVLAFSPDSKRLAACDDAQRYSVYDVKTREEVASLDMQQLGAAVVPYGLAFTPDGKRVVAAGQGTGVGVYVWELKTGKVLGDTTVRPVTNRSMALSSDGKTLVTGYKELKVFDLTEEKKKAKPKP